MSNFTPVAIALTGVGGAICSYCVSPKQENKSTSSRINVLFKDRYEKTLLDPKKDSDLWRGKWNAMKKGKPTHPLLKKSIEQRSYIGDAKKLHQEGCDSIYNSTVIATPYFLDFKYYCAKTNRDVIGKNWVTDEVVIPKSRGKAKKKDNMWNKKLQELQKISKQELQGDLLEIFEKIEKLVAPKDLTDENRKELKDWCDSLGGEMYLGDDGMDVKNAKKLCISK